MPLADTKLAEVMEKELNGPKLVALCLGFARVISDMTEKRQHDAAGSSKRIKGGMPITKCGEGSVSGRTEYRLWPATQRRFVQSSTPRRQRQQ